jgi:hypothetical protein
MYQKGLVCKLVQLSSGSAVYPDRQMRCAYCGQEATMKIVSDPEQVCLEHALEFWTGLMVYARDRSDCCVKHERLCTCRSCEEFSDHERFPIRLAS